MALRTDKFNLLRNILDKRILVLDGAMGSLIQSSCSHNSSDSLSDLLVLENPELIKDIHRRYLLAGADIIETNSFNSNSFSLSDYGLASESYRLSYEAARLAREVVDDFNRRSESQPRFVAGSVCPTKLMLSLANNDPDLTFDFMAESYSVQIRGLLDGGADIILLETVFDTLNVKAAIYALSRIEEERGEKVPVMVSATVSESGRLLSGQSIEAFYASVCHAGLLSIGINCGFGSGQVLPVLRRLAEIAECAVSVYPNAGLPDDCGVYHEDPESFVENLSVCLKERLVNIVGGCCGTTPGHIRLLASKAREFAPRVIPSSRHSLSLSNLDFYDLGADRNLIQVGERTNVAGSARFARLIREKNFDEALRIAVRQIETGAKIIDVCMDDALEDSAANMVTFLRMLNSDPVAGKVPVMIDSSDWSVIVEALKVCQGKCIVNSISLKDGEEEFLNRAREIRRLGAAAMVMLFDESGQADTFERKIEIAARTYSLLVNDCFEPSDIIFDPNVLTVGASMRDSDPLALDFIRAVRWIKDNLPYVSVSGGISNLSFAFRGNNPLREAMHSVFLYHAFRAGLDMAIVNAGLITPYDDIPSDLLSLLEDLILCRKDNAVSALIDYASCMGDAKGDAKDDAKSDPSLQSTVEKQLSLPERIERALTRGSEKEMEELLPLALEEVEPMALIENVLMPAMRKIGDAFGEGRIFLPQMIKSAQTMKRAVELLKPSMSSTDIVPHKDPGPEPFNRTVVIATVKGDVHDIGKNILGLIVSCSGYNVIDLGVRVDEVTIADKAEESHACAVLLSGLISPSLNEMVRVCREFERRNLDIPVFIGGAATSEMHTALRIAPVYSGPVFYSPDAATNLRLLNSLDADSICRNRERQEWLRCNFSAKKDSVVSPASGSPSENVRIVAEGSNPCLSAPSVPTVEDVSPLIDWEWIPASLDVVETNEKARVIDDAKALFSELNRLGTFRIEGVARNFPVSIEGDDIILNAEDGSSCRLPTLRAEKGPDAGMSLVDFLNNDDSVVLFAVGVSGADVEAAAARFREKGDVYRSFLVKLIADRIAEAAAQSVSDGLRVAFGYPSAPDHTLKRDVFRILDVEGLTGMRLTENSMIVPSESVCGMVLPRGRYITVGKLGDSQLARYAAKRGMSLEALKDILPNNVAVAP